MGEFSKWLLHEEQNDFFLILFATALNIVFLALVALLLWPADKATLVFRLGKGYWIFWNVLYLTMALLNLFRRIFRIDIDTRFDAYVISALAVSSFLQAGWSAFAALSLQLFLAGTSAWMAAALYLAGALSCYVAFVIVSALYQGHIYRLVNLPLAFASFLVFSLWPAGGRAVYGWFFNLFFSE